MLRRIYGLLTLRKELKGILNVVDTMIICRSVGVLCIKENNSVTAKLSDKHDYLLDRFGKDVVEVAFGDKAIVYVTLKDGSQIFMKNDLNKSCVGVLYDNILKSRRCGRIFEKERVRKLFRPKD